MLLAAPAGYSWLKSHLLPTCHTPYMTAPTPGLGGEERLVERLKQIGKNSHVGLKAVSGLSVCRVNGCAGRLTAVTLDSSLQVLRRPLCSKSLCWTTAGSSEPSSISWLADRRAVSSVCWKKTTCSVYRFKQSFVRKQLGTSIFSPFLCTAAEVFPHVS